MQRRRLEVGAWAYAGLALVAAIGAYTVGRAHDCASGEPAFVPSERATEVAERLPELIAAWDEDEAVALFPNVTHVQRMRTRFAWFRERLGPCGDPQPIAVASATHARFAYRCRHGVLEAAVTLGEPDGHAIGLLSGMRGAEPPQPVRAAADTVVALLADWDRETFESTFNTHFTKKYPEGPPRFMTEVTEELGRCELGAVDLASATGALFVLECERGRRTLVVGLDGDDKIRRIKFAPLRRDPSD